MKRDNTDTNSKEKERGFILFLVLLFCMNVFAYGAFSGICMCNDSCSHCDILKRADNKKAEGSPHQGDCCEQGGQSLGADPGKCRTLDLKPDSLIRDKTEQRLDSGGVLFSFVKIPDNVSKTEYRAHRYLIRFNPGSIPIYIETQSFLC